MRSDIIYDPVTGEATGMTTVVVTGPQGPAGPAGPVGPAGTPADTAMQDFLVATRQTGSLSKPGLVVDNMPLYVFSVNNDTAISSVVQPVNRIYLDGLFNSWKDVYFSGRKPSVAINPKTSGSITLPLRSDTLTPPAVTVNNLTANLSAVTSRVRLMGIGASLTALQLYDIDGSKAPYWGIHSKVQYNFVRMNAESPSVPKSVLVGHLNFDSRDFSFKGSSLTVRGGNVAIASWAGSHFLNHAIRLCGIDPGGTYDSSASGFVRPNISYYLLGLQASTGAAWSGTAAQQELIRTTIMGKNVCDKNATLYDWMKVQVGWGGANDTYTGTATQNTNMNNFLTYLCDNPYNPFYSRSQAQTGGSTRAFSMSAYLGRYKTLADDGITRLVVGSTAGSKVTDVNAYDVCTPTHVTINFLENDLWLFPNAAISDLVATIHALGTAITTEYPSIRVGLLNSPRPGTLFPDLFPDGVRYAKLDAAAQKAAIRAAYIQRLGITSSNPKSGNIYFLDGLPIMYPLSHQYALSGESAGAAIDVEETIKSDVHPGLAAAASTGDLIWAWTCQP